MSLGSACMGFAGGLFLDRLNRRSVLETKSAMSAKAKIELAYRNKERLLLSVLPKCVADEMLKDVGNLADGQFRKIYMSRYENVSILFADIVGFTAISSTVTAAELVKILNELFASFDVLANKFHQVRIKILGDCYYCVCGALEPRPDHAVLAIHMGLSMVDAISAVRQKTGKDVNMRVGVHTGACLGGVLGQRQWQFDVLGKEVTLANKMESGGLPARVHISEATRACLNGEFELEEGHGEEREEELRLKNVRTYLVKSVLKPYPEGTLDMPTTPTRQTSNGFHRNKRSSSQSQTEQGDEADRDEADGDPVGSGEEEYKKEFSLKLQRELLAKERDSKLLEIFQPLTLNFKDKALEVRFQQRSDSYSGLPVVALSVALVLMFVAKLCISPRTLTTVLIYLGGVIILAAMGVVSMAFTFAQKFPKSVVRFAMSVEKHAVLKLLWGFTGCVVFFLCDAVPVFQCEQRNVTINIKNGSHIATDDSACFYIVYYTHGANLILIAISSMVNLGHVVKGVLIFLVTGSHCLIVLLGVEGTYGNYNRVLYEDEVYPHIKYRLLGQMIASAVALNFFNFQMELTTRKLYLWKEESKKEKEKAADLQVKNEALVYNLMPAHVAKDFLGRRKKDSELYSHSYEETGVMFAACPNFHAFYNESSINNNGLECLRFLNEIISDYDELLNLAKFSTIVKIKTVGPTYMAASGMVAEDTKKQVSTIKERWSHLHDLVQFAHALQDVIKKINEQSFNNFILRIGINHGPIIAGVIGARKPHYDIWGNTVNVSSRMESTGQAGRIQVVEETKNILEVFGYTFEKRGLIKVKGKGELMTYFLERQVEQPDMHMPHQVPET
ncbi:adenylate cyclase type 3-like isoform X2 [Physella acuta]|nr:adenylate cyclase type 3-like isoform X2 [Physella acuta]